MAISRVVSEIFNVKISRPGKHGLGSIKVTENGTIQWIGCFPISVLWQLCP